MRFTYKGHRWVTPVSLLLALGTIAVMGWGTPDPRSWTAAGLAGAAVGVHAMRYRAAALTYRQQLESGIFSAFARHLQEESRVTRTTNADRLNRSVRDLEN